MNLICVEDGRPYAKGKRRTEKVHGTRNDYRQVYKDDYLLVDGVRITGPVHVVEMMQEEVRRLVRIYE